MGLPLQILEVSFQAVTGSFLHFEAVNFYEYSLQKVKGLKRIF